MPKFLKPTEWNLKIHGIVCLIFLEFLSEAILGGLIYTIPQSIKLAPQIFPQIVSARYQFLLNPFFFFFSLMSLDTGLANFSGIWILVLGFLGISFYILEVFLAKCMRIEQERRKHIIFQFMILIFVTKLMIALFGIIVGLRDLPETRRDSECRNQAQLLNVACLESCQKKFPDLSVFGNYGQCGTHCRSWSDLYHECLQKL